MTTSERVCEWLVRCGCTNTRPVQIQIKGRTYEGAEYVDPKHPDKRIRYYLVGPHPAAKKRGVKEGICYRFVNTEQIDTRDWYIATYYPIPGEDMDPHFAEYHPFGNSIILCYWPHEDERFNGQRIDHYENKPYERVSITLEYEN
jgi:hypothetical protein